MKLSELDRQFLFRGNPVEMINRTFGLGFRLDPVQAQVVMDQSSRIIVKCCRQWGKTTTVAARAAAEARIDPGLILVVAPVERQAREALRKISGCLKRNVPGEKWVEDQKTSLELPNGARVVALPAKGETLRGYTNPKTIIMDEAAFTSDDDYRSLRPMLSHGARLIVMSTPFGKRGFFFEIWTKDDPRWSRYEVNADECSHIPREFLEEERLYLGPTWYSQEYEGQFLDSVAGFFDMEAVRAGLDEGIEPLFPASGEHIDNTIEPLFPEAA